MRGDAKIALVTGASSGIGKQTALALAGRGYRTIMHGRDAEKLAAARDWVVEQTGNPKVTAMAADLSLMAEVRGFAERVAGQIDHIDVLVNNAGAQFGSERRETSEGHEKTFAINTLSPFLLTNLLLPLLERSASARVVTVASESYRQAGLPELTAAGSLANPELESGYSMARAYAHSKLYVWWLMRELDRRLRERGVTNVAVNTVEPGSAVTGLQRESLRSTWYMLPLSILWLPFMRTSRHGARTSVYMATSPEVKGVSGEFWGNCRRKRIPQRWMSEAGQRAIWAYCEQVCEAAVS